MNGIEREARRARIISAVAPLIDEQVILSSLGLAITTLAAATNATAHQGGIKGDHNAKMQATDSSAHVGAGQPIEQKTGKTKPRLNNGEAIEFDRECLLIDADGDLWWISPSMKQITKA